MILYLHMIDSDSCQHAKLAGIQRYAEARGWRVEAFSRQRSRARMVPALLARHRPLGCIVEGAGRWDDLSPALFGSVPTVYIDVLDEKVCGDCPRIVLDPDSIARTAFRELAAGKVAGASVIEDTPERPFRNLVFEDTMLAGETSPRIVTTDIP